MGDWRTARSLDVLLNQLNAMYPGRAKGWDGSIGDAAHQSRTSDHNPWINDPDGSEIVSARDFTNDPGHGLVSEEVAHALVASRDPRIKYVISNRRIYAGDLGPSPWVGRNYTGANPHDHHVHVSVKSDKAHYDSVLPWDLSALKPGASPPVPQVESPGMPVHPAPPPVANPIIDHPILRKGSKDDTPTGFVHELQTALSKKALLPPNHVDGDFGTETDRAVRLFQTAAGLVSDGVVGGATWTKLKGG